MNIISKIQIIICTLGYVGKIPFAPGTFGSLAATLLAPLIFMPFSLPTRTAIIIFIFLLGAICATHAEKIMQQKDPSSVVIDELVGQWICFLPFTSLTFTDMGIGFIFFRIFDIFKPWPVRSSETWLPSGYGIMIDDVFAGLYASILLGFYILFL